MFGSDLPLVTLPAPRHTRYGLMRAAAFNGDAAVPRQSEVVIIGGGIIGVTTAYFLAKRGIPVVLCEKAEIACEASSRAFGWVSELMIEPAVQPMAQLAKRMWAELQTDIGEAGYRRHGIAYLADDDDGLETYRGWLSQSAALVDPATRILSSAEVRDRYPTATDSFAGGLFSPSDGSAEPVLAATAIANAARRAGAKIVPDCAVRGLDIKGGRVAGVYTEKGYVQSSTVLCAANSWTRLFCGNLGIDIPQVYVVMSMGATGPVSGPVGSGGQELWAWRRQVNGGYALGGVTGVKAPATRDALRLYKQFKPMMEIMGSAKPTFGRDAWNDLWLRRRWDPKRTSPFEKLRVLSGTVDPRNADDSFARNCKVFPEMASGKIEQRWAGTLPLTPDGKPIIGAVDTLPGFHLVTACSFGISWAPAIGKLMSDMMTSSPLDFDPSPFRLSRFSDGSPLDLGH